MVISRTPITARTKNNIWILTRWADYLHSVLVCYLLLWLERRVQWVGEQSNTEDSQGKNSWEEYGGKNWSRSHERSLLIDYSPKFVQSAFFYTPEYLTNCHTYHGGLCPSISIHETIKCSTDMPIGQSNRGNSSIEFPGVSRLCQIKK